MLKRKSKRFLSIILAAAMLISMFPITAFADEAENSNDTQTTPVVSTTLPAADANGVITLQEDVTTTGNITVSNANTIDLNGYTLTLATLYSNTDLTIRDNSPEQKGVLTSSGNFTCVVWGRHSLTLESGAITNTNGNGTTVFNLGTFTMNDGTISGTTVVYNAARNGTTLVDGNIVCNINGGTVNVGTWGIVAMGAGFDENGNVDNDKVTVNITGGNIVGTNGCQGIATNASSGRYSGFTINISGGAIDAGTGTGMYLSGSGETNISGGTVKGAQAIRICAGDLNITGGTIEGTALSDGADLIAGASGGTLAAIVVGKAGNGYVGDINVNISDNAQVINTATKNSPSDVASAIVVSDKNMASSTTQHYNNPETGQTSEKTFSYTDTSINVNVSASVTGDIVKVSNLTQGENNRTQDGGNTNLDITDASVTGNVINQSTEGNVKVTNTTVTGDVTSTSKGNTLIDNSSITGTASNNSTDNTGNVTILSSTVGSVAGTTIVVNSVVNGSDTSTNETNYEALIGTQLYQTLEEAITNAEDGDVVILLKNVTVDGSDKTDTQGILTITKDITINGNGKTITAENVSGTPSMINVQNGANVTINDLILDGAVNGANKVKHGVNIYQATVTLNDVTVKNHTGYASVVNGSNLTVNGLTTANNGWGGINVEGKAGAADLVVIDANIAERNSIKFEQTTPTTGTAGSVSATINGGNFEYITTGKDVDPDMLINGGTFGPLTDEAINAGAVDIADYLASGLEFNPVTGQVYKEPEYTGKYSYEIFTTVGDNGAIDVDRYATEGNEVTITVSPDEAYMLDEMTITSGGKDVEVTDNGDGTYTFTMPSGDVKIEVTFAEDPNWEEEPAMPFVDVDENDWFYDVVLYAYENGLMTGTSADTFAPNTATTRGMIVSMLARLEGVTSAESAGFTDVADNDWYATAVNWAASEGIVNGFEDDTFRPNDAITREQMAAILYNYADYKGYDVSARADLSDYADAASISSWAEDVLAWANAEGLINGMTATTIDPQGATTRAQTAAMFERFLTAHAE